MKKLILISFVIFLISICIILIKINEIQPATLHDSVNNYDFFGNHDKFATYLLYQVHDNVTTLINHLNKHYGNTDNVRIREGLYRLNNRYHINRLIENVPSIFSTDTSYTINKGELLLICMRYKNQPNKFHDINLIMFVVTHELAHIFSVSYQHLPEFWQNFKFLLKEAIKCKIYEYEDYNTNPRYYCGMTISHNPAYDNNIANII
jgi:hypothetical protein